MRRPRLHLFTPLFALVLAMTTLAVAPAGAGPTICTGNSCPVSSEAELLQALAELDAIVTGVGRIELTADVVLTVGEADPVYNGTRPLTIDGNGFTIDGNGTSQILVHTPNIDLNLLDVTIEGGLGNGGQGAIAATGKVTVTDSVLNGNRSENTSSVNGGALTAGGTIGVIRSEVTNNTAEATGTGDARGGALYSSDEVVIIDSTVTGNRADGPGSGAGGAAFGVQRVSLQGSTVSDNRAVGMSSSLGGAASSSTEIDVTDSELARNQAGEGSSNGGYGGALQTDGPVTITRSGFDHNFAAGTNVALGGAVQVTSGDITLVDSIFIENDARATNSIARGGAIHGQTGPDVSLTGSTLRDNNALSTNSTSNGGGIYVNNGGVSLIDSSMVGNYAQGSLSAGGGIDAPNSSVAVYNSTIAGNIASAAGGINANQSVDLRFATVVDNVSPGSSQIVTTGTMFAAASVIAKPLGGGATNCTTNNTVSQVANYDSGMTCGFGDHVLDVTNGGDPKIGPARDNGGPRLGPVGASETTIPLARFTAHPLLGSPLIDVMGPADCNLARNEEADLIDDQRDGERPFGFECDIGAIEAIFPTHGFTDSTTFYEPTIRWITSDVNTPNILDGYGDNTFRHTLNITRGQAARLYYRAAGQPDVAGLPQHPFTDVTPFYQDAVRWAWSFGVFDGYGDNTFRQANPITRGNYIRSLYGFAGSPEVAGLPQHGLGDVTTFYENAVRWAKGNGLANGYQDLTFRQTNNISRGDASRTAFNLAQSPAAWYQDGIGAPPNVLFKKNYS